MIPNTKANIGPKMLLLVAVGVTTACAGKTPPAETPPVSAVAQPTASAEPKPAQADTAASTSAHRDVRLERVHFAFDSYSLDEQARARLQANAAQLGQAREVQVVIEGHCDDVGTTEYNLVLGERRADATRRYLATLGVDDGRLRIISYGKEKPLAHGEGGREQNRRAEFVVRP